jgi:hypothetical protein
VLDRLLAELSPDRPLSTIDGDALADLLEQLWGRRAPATWNRNRAAVAGWLSWCTRNRLPAPTLPVRCERRRESVNATRAISRSAIERALTRRDVPLREKTLWRLLYVSAARANESSASTSTTSTWTPAEPQSAPRTATRNGSTGAPAQRACCPDSYAGATPALSSSPNAGPRSPASPVQPTARRGGCWPSPGPGRARRRPGRRTGGCARRRPHAGRRRRAGRGHGRRGSGRGTWRGAGRSCRRPRPSGRRGRRRRGSGRAQASIASGATRPPIGTGITFREGNLRRSGRELMSVTWAVTAPGYRLPSQKGPFLKATGAVTPENRQ